MKQWFLTTWDEIRTGKNLDVYLTLLVAVVILFIDIFGQPEDSSISEATLVVLSILAYSMLVSRRQGDKIENMLDRLDTPQESIDNFLKQQYDHSEIEKQLRNSNKAFFWGFTLTRTIPLIKDEVEDRLKSGLAIRFLLLKPSSEAVRMNAFRKAHRDEATSNSQLLTNLSNLADVAKRTKNGPGKLEVRCIDQLPPWTIVATNPHLQTGHMYVRLSSFRVLNKLRPTFELAKAKESELFDFFVEQFETVWEDAEIVDLGNYIEIYKSQN